MSSFVRTLCCIGTIVDWDSGFRNAWFDPHEVEARSTETVIKRELSYFMEECVLSQCSADQLEWKANMTSKVQELYHRKGFQLFIYWYSTSQQMSQCKTNPMKVMICTSPVYSSRYCVQEKINWIRVNLGEEWVTKVIFCQDKVGSLITCYRPCVNWCDI